MVELNNILFITLFIIVIIQRIIELYLSSKNTKIAQSKGGTESGRSHYFLFFLLHIGWMVSWCVEYYLVGSLSNIWTFYLLLLISAELLRYWAIQSLGENWNTRIFVIPGNQKVSTGPYKFISHPNYIVVAIEIFILPFIFNLYFTAIFFSILNGIVLLFIRIPAENKAWREK